MIELLPPVKSVRKQRWGITTRKQTPTWDLIFKYGLSQDFGNAVGPLQASYESFGLKGHNGFDIVLYSGDPLYASHDGVVFEGTGMDASGGVGIVIWSQRDKFKTIYWHNLRNIVEIGDKVRKGDLIAYGDNTGFSTGSHLHFGLKLTDDKGQTLNKENGYRGAISPHKYLVDYPIKDMLTYKQVKLLYELWDKDYTEKDLEYWSDMELDALLKRRLLDKSERLQKAKKELT